MHTFEKKSVREDVKLNLPEGWDLQVYKVISGDTGKDYWIQILARFTDDHSTGVRNEQVIPLCDCPEGKFKQPLAVLGLKDFWCKHSKALVEFLKSEGR